eukprot:TRINITY_DN3081_c2_g1_i1.p1 TRINITY_DN3081_c2_g1~~TRINITY_DN3081_c2_g1_i1.p1  ORF type:complete len:771 (+),score=47.91 TRINITY_DN3081_c2_g1_i1:288-2600(+)
MSNKLVQKLREILGKYPYETLPQNAGVLELRPLQELDNNSLYYGYWQLQGCVTSTKGTYETIPEKEQGQCCTRMAQYMRDTGKTTKHAEKEDQYIKIVMHTQVSGKMIKPTEWALTIIRTVLNIQDRGQMTNSMAMEQRSGQMAVDTKVPTQAAKSTVQAFLGGLMVQNMRGTSTRIIYMEKECIGGMMDEFTKVDGIVIGCKDMASSIGRMVNATRENLWKIKSREKAYLNGTCFGKKRINYYRPSGKKYQGEWVNGKQSGRGVYINDNGIQKEGIWENGNRIKWLTDDQYHSQQYYLIILTKQQQKMDNEAVMMRNIIRHKTVALPQIPEESKRRQLSPARKFSLEGPSSVTGICAKIGNLYEQLQDVVSDLEIKIGCTIKREEKEIIEAYKEKLANIQEVLDTYKRKVEYQEVKLQKDEMIGALKDQLEHYKREHAAIAKTSLELRNEMHKLKLLNESLENEKRFYEKKFKETKKKNKALRMALNKLSATEVKIDTPVPKELPRKSLPFNDKFDIFIGWLLNAKDMDKDGALEKCREYYQNFSQRTEEVIASLRQQLAIERKAMQKLRAAQTDSQLAKTELEQLFCECVEEMKRKLGRKKLDVRNEIKGESTGSSPRLSSSDKALIIEQFMTNEKLLRALYTTVFQSSYKVNENLIVPPQKIIFSEFNHKRKYIPAKTPSNEPFKVYHSSSRRSSISSYSFPRRSLNISACISPNPFQSQKMHACHKMNRIINLVVSSFSDHASYRSVSTIGLLEHTLILFPYSHRC